MPDRKGKGPALSGGESPEARVLEALKQALQLNPAAADAVLREVKGVTGGWARGRLGRWWVGQGLAVLFQGDCWEYAMESSCCRFGACLSSSHLAHHPHPPEPGAHAVLDLWLLLVLLTLGAERRKAAETLLRRKFAEGHAEPGWLRKGIEGHEVGGWGVGVEGVGGGGARGAGVRGRWEHGRACGGRPQLLYKNRW